MNKFTLIKTFTILTIVFHLQNYLFAQCNGSYNEIETQAIEELGGEYYYTDGPIILSPGYIDTLGECRISSISLAYRYFEDEPIDLSKFPYLKSIEFYDCQFSDLESIDFSNSHNLENLTFYNNSGNNFEMPDFDIPSLKSLNIGSIFSNNFINSEIPDFSNMPQLRFLKLTQIGLYGDVPDFSNLRNLETLNIQSGTLKSSIPNFSGLPNLKNLMFDGHSNSQLSGEIPNFDKLPKLQKLIIENSSFTGKIPNFEKIPLLEELIIGGNQLSGVIPNFDNLPLLAELFVCSGGNDFIGPLPTLDNCPLININDIDFSCVRPAPESNSCPISESDSLELVNFYQNTNGDNWQINTGWLNERMTSWWGIDFIDTLGKCRVNKILIRGIDDEVELPSLNLPFLEELIIDYNNFTGAIPDLSNLNNLKTLNLRNNNFIGNIPDINTFSQLEKLNLSNNELTGNLPSFANNPLIKEINLSNNLITGTLPDFQTISGIHYLNVSGNQLSGIIPNFTNLPNLYTCNVADNELTGGLPNFSNLPFLQSLLIENNQLSGRIPNFNNMPLLEELIVCDNNFEGTAPNFSFSPLLNVDAIDFSCLQAAKVRGYVYYDTNENCIFDEGDSTIPNGLITINNGANYQPIDENGYYEIALEVGASVLTFIQTSPLWQTSCEDIYTITSTSLNDITEIDFANQPNVECSELTVDIGTPFLRRCFKNTYTVQYCNQGTQPATDAFVEINFEEEIIPLNASIPYEEDNNLLTFQLGEIGIGECGSFTVVDSVSCIAPLSSTGCVEAHIYPDEFCIASTVLWDGANLVANAFCLANDSVQFVIENLGLDMMEPSPYKMYEEAVMTVQGEIMLNSGATKVLNYPATGATYRVAVEQTPGHPSQDDAQAFFELCGNGSFSTGYINALLLPDRDPYIDIDCEEIIGSYDPNDKLVTPTGVGESNDIYEGDELTYKIRFQNTGNDTAFTVVLVDTLDVEHLNISTLEVLNSSHPYALAIEDAQILTFTFNNILLVDSTKNEPESHGFVTFKIDQNINNEIGDVIENKADIYFDYNEAIVTPRIFNTLAEPEKAADYIFIPFTVDIELENTNHLFAKVYPNPATDVFYIELPNEVTRQYPNLQLEIYNIEGQSLLKYPLNKTHESITVSDLNSGIYYYRMFAADLSVGNGKLLIE